MHFKRGGLDKDVIENMKCSEPGGRSAVLCCVLDYTGKGDTRHTSPLQVSARTELENIYDQLQKLLARDYRPPRAPLMASYIISF